MKSTEDMKKIVDLSFYSVSTAINRDRREQPFEDICTARIAKSESGCTRLVATNNGRSGLSAEPTESLDEMKKAPMANHGGF
jgi:hypothetical protein